MLNFARSRKLEHCGFKGLGSSKLSVQVLCLHILWSRPDFAFNSTPGDPKVNFEHGSYFFPEMCSTWKDIIPSKVSERPWAVGMFS